MTVNTSQARDAVLARLASHGHPLSPAESELALVGLGVNSVTLVQVIASLEDEFDLDFDTERLFSTPVTIAALVSELLRLDDPGAPPQPHTAA